MLYICKLSINVIANKWWMNWWMNVANYFYINIKCDIIEKHSISVIDKMQTLFVLGY
jgi:hypothetical protein